MRRTLSSCTLTVLALLSFLPLTETPLLGEEIKTLWVAHRRVDCIGVSPQRCYLIKETQYEDWKFWYGEIEGFPYEEGYAYEIRVVEHRIENPPADAAAIELELVEVVLKVETDEGILPAVPAAPTPPAPAPPEPSSVAPVEIEVSTPAPPEPSPPAPRPIETPSLTVSPEYRGHLIIGAGIETRSFRLCGAEESIWIEDRTEGDLWGTYRQLAGVANRPLYVVVRGRLTDPPPSGFGAHYKQQLLVEELRQAATESAGCFDDRSQFAFRAVGNEPSWNLEISRRGLVYSQMGVEGRTLFPYSPPTFLEALIIYQSQTGGSNARSLLVRLEEESCRDTMADASYSFAATLEIDGQTLSGCALEGKAEP